MGEDIQLMKESLESASEYLEKVKGGIGAIVYNLQSGREDKAIPVCIELIDGLKWLFDCFSLTLPYQLSKGKEIDLLNVKQIIQQIVESLENRDYVLLGDLLEYEVLPIVENWQGQVNTILE